jgi:hypothetical protein
MGYWNCFQNFPLSIIEREAPVFAAANFKATWKVPALVTLMVVLQTTPPLPKSHHIKNHKLLIFKNINTIIPVLAASVHVVRLPDDPNNLTVSLSKVGNIYFCQDHNQRLANNQLILKDRVVNWDGFSTSCG